MMENLKGRTVETESIDVHVHVGSNVDCINLRQHSVVGRDREEAGGRYVKKKRKKKKKKKKK